MDWLAGSRLHLLDVILTRGLTYVPIFVLGFSERALMVYVFIVAAQATFIHANVRWEFRSVRKLFATPAFHHWHHSAEREAIDKNFAVHTPIWDILFGTYYLPDRWPTAYGLTRERTFHLAGDSIGILLFRFFFPAPLITEPEAPCSMTSPVSARTAGATTSLGTIHVLRTRT